MRNCTHLHCKQNNPQPLENFSFRSKKRNTLESWCKKCVNEKNLIPKHKEKRKEYSDKLQNKINKKRYEKSRHLMMNYGIDLNEYNKMRVLQNHVCKICGIDELSAGKYGLVVDHNHDNNQVRSLLCVSCNVVVGVLEGRKEIVKKAIDYINFYNLSVEKSKVI